MHKFLKVCAFVIALLLFAPAAMAGENCEARNDCIPFGDSRPARAAVDDMVCIWFNQSRPGDVMLVLYEEPSRDGRPEGSGILFEKTRWHDVRSKYCFGAWRLDDAQWIMLCGNSRRRRNRSTPQSWGDRRRPHLRELHQGAQERTTSLDRGRNPRSSTFL
jgi:hypothetical protein